LANWHCAFFSEQAPNSSSLTLFSMLNVALISHCFYVEATTIGFANYSFSSMTRSPAAAKAGAGTPTVYSGEAQRVSALSGMHRLVNVSAEPLESHPVDRLLPLSRLQQMKKLLQVPVVAYPEKTKSPR
jgi:hypothetical protein